jgi:hypothetical protein
LNREPVVPIKPNQKIKRNCIIESNWSIKSN